MKKQSISYKTVLSVFLAAVCLAGCQPAGTEATESQVAAETPTTPSEASQPQQAGEPVAINSSLILDPAKTEDTDSFLISAYLYEGLVRMDEAGTIQPGIAESWVISDDQLDYIFEIRPNARFSDGSPITTDIIVENFNRWFEPTSPLHGDGYYPTWSTLFLAFNGERDAQERAISQVDGIQKVDTNTVIVHLNRPEPNTLAYLSNPAFAILSPAALTSGDYGKIPTTILSSGPYIIYEWTNSGLTLAPNSNYWNPVEGDLKFVWK